MTAIALRPVNVNDTATLTASGGDMMSDTALFELAQRWATAFSKSQLVPAHLRDKPADCLIGILMARQLRVNPLLVLQNIYIVSGKAGWAANFMIACANSSGVLKGRITWETRGSGRDMEVMAKATTADTGDLITATVSMQMAHAEGWTNNKKYQTMPEHMLRWRSATMLIRLYCPEVLMGMQTADEIEDTPRAETKQIIHSLDAFAGEDAATEVETGAAADVTEDAADSQDVPAIPPSQMAYVEEVARRFESCGDDGALDDLLATAMENAKGDGATDEVVAAIVELAKTQRLRIQQAAAKAAKPTRKQ